MDNRAIGIFDSGLGGLSIWKEFIEILPNESVIYYADSKNCPYGTKSEDEVIELSKRITEFLLKKDVKLIIVACNTATAAAIDFLRKNFTIPFIGIEPAIKPAASNSKTKSVAVLATEGTFNGRLYNETSKRFASDTNIEIIIGEGLVEIVEEGKIDEKKSFEHVKLLLKPYINSTIDHLVLGCTHYPFLLPVFTKLFSDEVQIINPADAVVRQAKKVLNELNINSLNKEPEYNFYTTGEPEVLHNFLSLFFDGSYLITKL